MKTFRTVVYDFFNGIYSGIPLIDVISFCYLDMKGIMYNGVYREMEMIEKYGEEEVYNLDRIYFVEYVRSKINYFDMDSWCIVKKKWDYF